MPESLIERWSSKHQFGARIETVALDAILGACRASGRIETGGVLVGKYSDDRRLATVLSASTPSGDTRSGPFWLIRGIRGLHSWLEKLWIEDRGYYIGEWHFHPFAAPSPSRQDLNQMQRIATTSSYQCASPLLLIIGGNPEAKWSIHLEVHTRSGERHILSSA